MDVLIRKICYRVRLVLDRPGFAVASTLSMAAGIGACAVIFSIANAVLLRQLPYRRPERLVEVKPVHPNGRQTSVCETYLDGDVQYE